LHRRPDSRER